MQADHPERHTAVDDDRPDDSRGERRLELTLALLLALATVAIAWTTYQAARWHGEQASAFARASAARIESTRSSGVANRQVQVDVAAFTQWVDAYAHDDARLVDFYRERFRDEFKPAVDAWIATKPLENPDAPQTPFAMPEYRLAAVAQADRLEAEAAAHSDEANEDIQRADRYVLCVVLFAAALFFAGISTRLRTTTARAAILALGSTLFLGTVIWLVTFPVST